jgi:cytoskeletal protein RodZ
MESVGEVLRSERLRRGLQVVEIAAATKIRPDLLEAIESGHFDLLPGGAYRRNFLRLYARELGMDEDATIASFHEQYADPPVELPAPGPDPPSQALRLAGALLALVLSSVGYRLVVDSPATSSGERATVAAPKPTTAAITPAPAPPPAPVPATYPQNTAAEPPRALRVAFSASEPVWVSVKCDGTQAFVGTLEGTQIKTFDASSLVTVLVGNAGGLTILLNGKPVGPLGGHGEIQQVELTPSGVRHARRHAASSPGSDTIPQV